MNKLSRVEVELRDANQSVAELKILKMEKEVASRDVLGKKAQLEKELAELSGIYDVKNKETGFKTWIFL